MLYGTISPDKERCYELLYRFNPKIEGVPYTYKVLPIRLALDLNDQKVFDLNG